MHFTRVLPYKIAHLQHVVTRSLVIPMFVAVLLHFWRMRQATEVAGGDRGHSVHPIFNMSCLFLFYCDFSCSFTPFIPVRKEQACSLSVFQTISRLVWAWRQRIHFQIKLDNFVYARSSKINPRFPFSVKIGFSGCSFLYGKTRVNRVSEGALKSS